MARRKTPDTGSALRAALIERDERWLPEARRLREQTGYGFDIGKLAKRIAALKSGARAGPFRAWQVWNALYAAGLPRDGIEGAADYMLTERGQLEELPRPMDGPRGRKEEAHDHTESPS